MTDNPKCLDFVYKPWRILLYLINVLSSAKSSTTNRQLYNLFILFFFWYSITLCCVSMMCARLSGSYSSNKYCSFLLSIFSFFSIYRITSLYASSMCAVGDTMYIQCIFSQSIPCRFLEWGSELIYPFRPVMPIQWCFWMVVCLLVGMVIVWIHTVLHW